MAHRRRLPNRRSNESFDFELDGLRFTATIGGVGAGRVAELFLTNHKAGSAAGASARDAAIILSLGLQHGLPLEAVKNAVLRDARGRPSTPVGMAIDNIPAEKR
jgi:hypothetical protein